MQNPKEDLQHIRQMMERSSRFMSLSGLSGVMAGIIALVGAGMAYRLLNGYRLEAVYQTGNPMKLELQLVLLALITLVLALGVGMYFTIQKSRRKGLKIWNPTTRLVLNRILVPLVVGGLFCLALIEQGQMVWVAATTLIFYGMALIHVAQHTYSDIGHLGYCEIILGIIASFLPAYGLIFWAFGFGVLHIIYGMLMYKKYK